MTYKERWWLARIWAGSICSLCRGSGSYGVRERLQLIARHFYTNTMMYSARKWRLQTVYHTGRPGFRITGVVRIS